MNSIDIFKYPRFPLSCEGLDFLQQMAKLTAKLASMGGNSYILSGCVVAGSNVSAGTVVINGEILPFVAGAIETYVVIEETTRNVTAEGQVYEGIYISRVCRFGTGAGQVAWADLRRVPDLFTVSGTLEEMLGAFTDHTENHRVEWDHVDDKPDIFASAVLYAGTVAVGDVANDKQQTVYFPSVETSNYMVCGSLRSTGSNWDDDNDVFWMVRNRQADSFQLLVHEITTKVQSLSFDYAIIKLT